MLEFPHTTGKTTTNLPDALGLRQLTEQHRYKVRPATISLRMLLGIMIQNQSVKFMTIYQG